MVSKKTTIVNSQGFHMRPANVFTAAMAKYPCDITIKYNGTDVNGKSLMNIIAACIKCGAEVKIVCDGDKEQEALEEAVALIDGGLGE